MNTLTLAKSVENYMIEMRRHFHENPELSAVEFETLKKIGEELTKMGIEYYNVPNGGIIGVIDSGKEGRSVLLRADIDALPIEENIVNGGGKERTCISKNNGVMHACGHDGHAATLLGVAKLLNENKDAFVGKIYLVFEQGEEGGGNYIYIIKYMENHGIKPDSVFAIHLQSSMDTGELQFVKGDTMAAAMGFSLTIKGRGGHGSRPDMSVSPVDCFVAVYNGINTIRMRNCDPYNPITFSVGHIQSGTKGNIIPNDLTFEGTVRLFNFEQGVRFRTALLEMLENTCKAYGCSYEINRLGYPGLGVYNDAQCTDLAVNAVNKYMGEGIAKPGIPIMGSESFPTFQRVAPGVYCFAGCRSEEKGITADHHNPQFDIDEASLVYSCGAYLAYAFEFLNNGFDTDDRKMKTSYVDFLKSINAPDAQIKKVEEYNE
ncbi:MAG: amidohydrolase [Clostridia bacterium]|nr:amidohydrolase [Clostridia bacterium]